MKSIQEIREIARALGNICVAVGEDRRQWGGIKDERIQKILALCGVCELYREALITFCSEIGDLPHSPTEGAFSTYKMPANWYTAWKWFTTHSGAVCLVNRTIESNATPEDLEQFSFKLSWFIKLAFEKELGVICEATKDYILECYRES